MLKEILEVSLDLKIFMACGTKPKVVKKAAAKPSNSI
jgi:hypothetical protein